MQSNTYRDIKRKAARLDSVTADRARSWADAGIMVLPVVQWACITSLSGKWAVASGLAAGAATLVCAKLHNHYLDQARQAEGPGYNPSLRSLEIVAQQRNATLG